jgi:hypothetical protein
MISTFLPLLCCIRTFLHILLYTTLHIENYDIQKKKRPQAPELYFIRSLYFITLKVTSLRKTTTTKNLQCSASFARLE